MCSGTNILERCDIQLYIGTKGGGAIAHYWMVRHFLIGCHSCSNVGGQAHRDIGGHLVETLFVDSILKIQSVTVKHR